MNQLLGIISLALCILIFLAYSHIKFGEWRYSKGFQHGHDEGYKAGVESGCKETDNWWIGLESEVDKERVKIWREEAQR